MIAATLFSGIGAPEEAMPHWDWRWCAEIEKFPSAVMAKRHPHSVNLGDVTAHDFCERAEKIGRPNVLVFGSPCQDFSVAGKRLGMDGARGNLALHALRIVARLKPDWFVFENVPGLLSNWSGAEDGPDAPGSEWETVENSDFAAFIGLVHELGYSGAWASLDAQYRGLAQRRDRLFFVGHIGDWRGPAAVLLEPDSLCGDHPPRREARKDVAGTITSSLERCSADEGERGTLIAGTVSSKWAKGTGGPAGDECQNLVADPITAREASSYTHEGKNFRARNLVQSFKPSHYTRDKDGAPSDVFPALSADADKGDQDPVIFAFESKDHGGDLSADLSPTLRAGQHDGSHANAGVPPAIIGFDTTQITHPDNRSQPTDRSPQLTQSGHSPCAAGGGMVRRLTPRECERLQGLPDDYTLIEYRGKPAADGPRYRSLGNSMAKYVIQWVLTRIEMVEALKNAQSVR